MVTLSSFSTFYVESLFLWSSFWCYNFLFPSSSPANGLWSQPLSHCLLSSCYYSEVTSESMWMAHPILPRLLVPWFTSVSNSYAASTIFIPTASAAFWCYHHLFCFYFLPHCSWITLCQHPPRCPLFFHLLLRDSNPVAVLLALCPSPGCPPPRR